jgi:hypothetical protein
MRVAPGDTIRMPVDGGRRPPVEGIVIDVQGCESVSGGVVMVVRRNDTGHIAFIPPGENIELLELAHSVA